MKPVYREGNCLKGGMGGGGVGQFAGLRRGLTKKEGVVFLRGRDGGSYGIVSLTLKTSPNIVGDIL